MSSSHFNLGFWWLLESPRAAQFQAGHRVVMLSCTSPRMKGGPCKLVETLPSQALTGPFLLFRDCRIERRMFPA